MKKLFSFFAATLLAASLMAADFTPTTVYKAGDLSTIGANWASKHQTANYFQSGDTTIFSAFLCYQSQGSGKQTWTGSISSGSTSTTWAATGCFKGSAAWYTSESKAAKTRSTQIYIYNVTNCSEVQVLSDNKGSNRELYIKAYRFNNGVIDTIPTDSVINGIDGLTVVSLSGLNVADTFQIRVCTNTDSNSNLYEIAFISAPAATDVATLKGITVSGQALEGFSAETLSYTVELPYGTTAVPEVTATPTLSNEQVNITPASAVPGATTIVATSADGTVSTTYTVNFTVSSTQSTDATLKSLKVAGTTISGFRADSIVYSYDVAYVDTVIPQVTAEVNDTTARLLIVQAPSVPGLASVTVTAQAGNTLTYSVLFVRLAAEKQIKELMYDNWYYAYQPAGNDTVFAHYIAGTEVPLIDHYVLSEGASLAVNLENSTFTVTGMDQTTAEYPYVLSPVTPFAAGNDTIWFNGSENYVICPYGFDSSKGGYKFSKTDSDYSREWNGKTHVDIFLTEADSIYLIGGVSDRKVKIRVNDVVTKTGNLGKDKNLWVPVHRSAPFCLSVISNQTGGDGSVKGIVVVHMQGGATACRNLSEQTNVRKFILNGQLVIERDGIRYNAAGQRL